MSAEDAHYVTSLRQKEIYAVSQHTHKPPDHLRDTHVPTHTVQLDKKLSYCWDSWRYDKISDSGRSANPNRNTKYDFRIFYLTNGGVDT